MLRMKPSAQVFFKMLSEAHDAQIMTFPDQTTGFIRKVNVTGSSQATYRIKTKSSTKIITRAVQADINSGEQVFVTH